MWIVVDSMRKTASLNNLSDYQHVADAADPIVKGPAAAAGHLSDTVVRVGAGRERKIGAHCSGTPWSEEEQKQFLMGLKKVGKEDWRAISKNFVRTRTHTQSSFSCAEVFS